MAYSPTLPPYLSPDFLKDILIAICKDADELPTYSAVEWLTSIARKSPPDTLQLRKARLGPTSTLQLAKRLEGSTLPIIDLYENAVKDIGFMALIKFAERHYTLKRLNCGCCGLSDESAAALSEILQQNCGLEAVELGIPTGYIFPAAGNVNSVYLNNIQENGISLIANALKQNNQLKYLGLAGNYVGQKSAAAALSSMLMENYTLTAINLSSTGLQNSGATLIFRSLMQNFSLQYLNIARNDISALAIPILASILNAYNTSLQELILDDNPLGSEGAKALACGLARNQVLLRLSLQNCALTDAGGAVVCAILSEEVFVNLNDTEALADAMHDILSEINLNQSDATEEKRIIICNYKGRVMSATSLRCRQAPRPSTVCGNAYAGREAVDITSQMDLGDVIDLDNPDMLYSNYSTSNSKSSSPARVSQHIFESKLNAQQLCDKNSKSAILFENDPDNMHFAEDEQSLTSQDHTSQVNPRYFETAKLYTRVDPGETSRYTDFTSMQQAELKENKLTYLNLGYNGLGTQTVKYLCYLLKCRNYLHVVLLYGNKLGDDSAILLAETLLNNYIELRYFKKNLTKFNPELSDKAKVNQNITSLNLQKCALADAGFAAIAFAFSSLPNAIYLNCSDNFINEKGGKKGIYYIQMSRILTVKLDGNQINHGAILQLNRKLMENRNRITMNAPRRLKEKISDIKQQTERLVVCREEMNFLKDTVKRLRNYLSMVDSQSNELQEQGARQIQSTQGRQEQTISLTDTANAAVNENKRKQSYLELELKQYYAANQKVLESCLAEQYQRQAKLDEYLFARSNAGNVRKQKMDDMAVQIQKIQANRENIIKQKEVLLKMVADISKIYGKQCAQAIASQVPMRLSLSYDYSQLEPSIKRCERIIGGAKQIPPIKLYDVNSLDFKVRREKSGKRSRSSSAKKPKSSARASRLKK